MADGICWATRKSHRCSRLAVSSQQFEAEFLPLPIVYNRSADRSVRTTPVQKEMRSVQVGLAVIESQLGLIATAKPE